MRFEPALSIPGRLDALELGAVGELAAERGTRFNVGFDFATILSSPVLCCILFDSTSGQLAELKKADIEQMEKIVPLITCESVLCQYVCELVFGANKFDLDSGVQVDSVKSPIKRNSVGPGYVSHCWTSAVDDHLDHRFIIFKNVRHRSGLRRIHV